MSHTSYFIGVLKDVKELEDAAYLTDETRGVFAASLLKDLKPAMMTKGYDDLREVVLEKISSLIPAKTEKKIENTPHRVSRETPKDEAPKKSTRKPRKGKELEAKDTSASDPSVLAVSRPTVVPRHGEQTKQS